MNKAVIFVLGLIGSILGIIGSFIWFFIGSLFIAGVISGIVNPELPIEHQYLTTQ
ncbi:hypothetical protein [Alkalihalobacillus sp. AL-G]|uniref:hypothetical protein n=1 Tax=Alkalihalobacillus sp. AL-G TaxID=2926399 RepID=UPI00272B634F|nr:hypothetical protein [Alkalihalobacillus sp. AL-G]WLD94420.1 hypothetical protein MOJ78_05900 [Alkalihalobacillus sp. AL-G]